jgi:hypothetical protein
MNPDEFFVWTQADGMQRLQEILEADGTTGLSGWSGLRAGGISDNGQWVAGTGTNPSGDQEAFLARLPDGMNAGFEINAGLNGNWWIGPDRNGEGVQVEVSDGGDESLILVATVYSYDDMGNQIFLIAVGTVNGDTAEVEVFITEGGQWGDNYDPALVIESQWGTGTESQWGTGTFTASSCDAMHMALMPNAEFQGMGYTDIAYDLIRLTTPAAPCPIDSPN